VGLRAAPWKSVALPSRFQTFDFGWLDADAPANVAFSGDHPKRPSSIRDCPNLGGNWELRRRPASDQISDDARFSRMVQAKLAPNAVRGWPTHIDTVTWNVTWPFPRTRHKTGSNGTLAPCSLDYTQA
jgi:hypothetical protein